VVWGWNRVQVVRIDRARLEDPGVIAFALDPSAWAPDPAPAFDLGQDRRERISADDGTQYSLYWGDLHSHSELSDGRQPVDQGFLLARDVYNLDFFCMADHDVNVTEGEWRMTEAVASVMNAPGRFVAFPGYESSYQWASIGAGHRNVVYPTEGGTICRYCEGLSLAEFQQCVRADGGIAIPHHIGRSFAPVDWSHFDPEVQPLVEICSVHGVFEYAGNPWKTRPEHLPVAAVDNDLRPVEGCMAQDGWARGLRFGVVGSTDSHYAHDFGVRRMALAAVYATDLTREALFDAFRARRTFATTGVRTFLDFRVNGHLMGEEIRLPRGREVRVSVAIRSPEDVLRADVVRNNKDVFSRAGEGQSLEFEWKDPAPPSTDAYYYVRVVMGNENFAWSSPVWVDWTD
jgi:hypothetical protein